MDSKSKGISQMKKRGYSTLGEQHNGFAMAKIVRGMTHKVVIQENGRTRKYIPSKTTKREKQIL